ncbi:class I SAM-dependent methyltransferase [Alkalihalophilus marmarensis]|jgi:ubiquinone/menaquinone biosynthesis C-methylase UbiE|uniref:Methyltransferase type 11 domain-containing protein n=1 Tax=Alkalihalophilus marmarensis DSM 21297 TaxID=1188261 RepID=U6SI94_9BACI|nr:class I SAM-dependent methyltransferase [Alkalihalophilus marmarensis]ERN51092.1 hypothetical protein A33I_02800 [Alkalihalophilus marmarensis DSM 21297]MCM3491371.1 class I SAM-dependent methyltransferase [Alkalihalophilus marmarensis]
MKQTDIIPFYGGTHPELFEIERRCMDREGKVIDELQQLLPNGLILDIGAGNGFTAAKLQTTQRTIIGMEPDELMIDRTKQVIFTKGCAQDIPFHTHTFDAAYSTWAFFFEGITDLDKGIAEMKRVVKKGGPLIIVDNYGEDEFCALSDRLITSSTNHWIKRGFDYHVIETAFIFDHVEEARKLLGFYFGEPGKAVEKTRFEYKVAVYTALND